MSRERRRLRRDAFNQIAVTRDPINKIVDNIEVGAIVSGGHVFLSDRHTDAVGKSLPERTRRRLNAGCKMKLRVPGGFAPELTKTFQIVKGEIIACQMKQAVEEHRSMSRRQHKP